MTIGRMHGLLAGVLLAGALLPVRASAQCTQSTKTAVSVNPALVSFSTPTFVDFDNGFILYQTTVTLNVTAQGNKTWSLCIASLQPDLGTAAGVTKPLGDLQFQYAGGGWVPLSLAPQFVMSDRGNVAVQLDLRMLLSWTADPAGSFGTVLEFTVN